MSRAMNLNATETEVATACTSLGVATTSLEALVPTGTRVVCQSSEGAMALRTKLKSKLIAGSVKRSPRFIAASAMR